MQVIVFMRISWHLDLLAFELNSLYCYIATPCATEFIEGIANRP